MDEEYWRGYDAAKLQGAAAENELRQKLERLTAERDRLKAALEGLVRKLKAVHADSRYMAVWQLYDLHGMRYTGPQYDKELEAAEAALHGEGREGER